MYKLSKIERAAKQQIFLELKPVCNQLAIRPGVDSAKEFLTVLENVNAECLQILDSYILMPIFMHISSKENKQKSSIICPLLECLQAYLSRITVKDMNLFLKVYVLVFSQILDGEELDKLSTSSEELMLSVVQCIAMLIKRSSEKVLTKFYTRQHYGKLSMGVYACTRIALNEKNIHLREETLEALFYLIQLQNETHSKEKKKQIADIVMLMLPGLVSHSLGIATATDIQNHKIVLLAIRLWSRAVGLVMEDNLENNEKEGTKVFSLMEKPVSNFEFINWTDNQAQTKDRLRTLTRSKCWIENSNKHLAHVSKAFSELYCHQHWKVRLELAIAVKHIISMASKNMSLSVPYFIELLIILSQDEQNEVTEVSIGAIKIFSSNCERDEGVKSLVEIVEESIYELLTRLPRILHGIDLTLKERQLSLVSGYLDILGKTHVPAMLRSAQHLQRLLKCLFIACTLESSSISLLEEISSRSIDDEFYSTECGWRNFKCCSTLKSQSILEQICIKIVNYSDLSFFAHLLLDKFNSELNHRKEITLLFCYIFSSGTASSTCEIECALSVFKLLMDQNLWSLPVHINVDDGINKEEAQSNVVQVCLLNEAVSTLSKFIGRELFTPLLLRCLYPLLECAGSSLYFISAAGLQSVKKVAELYGGGVSELVSNNVDYLSHHVTLNLRHAHRNPRVLAVLSVIMKHSSYTVLPSLHEIVNNVLVQSCDTFQEVNASAFLQVFHTFILSLKNWFPDEFSIHNKIKYEKSILEELLEYQRARKEAEELDNEEIGQEVITEEEIYMNIQEDKTDVDVPPNYIILTVEILKRSLHFLPSKNQSRQITVIEILENGVMILRKWTDELLPIVHKIWSPLVQRFNNCDNYLILERSFSLLKNLGKVSREFIRNRTLKEVLPTLCDTLKRTSKASFKCNKAAYKLSQKYKLQLSLIRGIGELALDMEFMEKEIDTVLAAVTPYLSNLQPQALQDACIDTFQLIAQEFPDLVWLHLMSICPKQLQFCPPIASLPTYEFQDRSVEMKEYKKNVHILLDLI